MKVKEAKAIAVDPKLWTLVQKRAAVEKVSVSQYVEMAILWDLMWAGEGEAFAWAKRRIAEKMRARFVDAMLARGMSKTA